ncbi:MAG: hypothetical protein AUJ41_02660 [Candidatus Pacebacteria bacterium CG1_02_43_31]|nr:hypothetical protein [Candidatus Paceibacterota bacterium]OIO44524.1 MAG: hypothetical protein AUJ41_02660 [Candidatus Pacebacteria bacterium CG1_02_43_31]PIQ80888.1 MAG: hypothetical protein COV78_03225 [Candidatus Pacebacteria bacterium CG11_big_fil_rev_8_21_14_0_20_34_55]PJC43822.1 MAG: hypothetical protein CO039_02090 [Candidatus Pacebacteria bacterium CG_4_9_14_0_2_um_filter_34_50]
MFALLISTWGILNLSLAIISIYKIRKNTKKCDFIWWWTFFAGAFVWEDMFVFGILHSSLVLFSLLTQNNTYWLVGFLVFWIVRSAGETLYFFLEQFIVPKHHPHSISTHFVPLRKLFGNISDQKSFIIMQVLMQSILVTSIFSLILVLKS